MEIGIGILGYGGIGQGVVKTILDRRELLERRGGITPVIKKISYRSRKPRPELALPENMLTQNPEDVVIDPEVQVVVLTMHTAEEYIFQILRAGASGYVVKRAAPSELISAVRAAYRGESFLSPSVSRTVVKEYIRKAEALTEEDSYEELTPREREVLQLIAEGHSNRGIAELLCLSVKTVQSHRANLMRKLDIYTTAELTQYAIRRGVTSLE